MAGTLKYFQQKNRAKAPCQKSVDNVQIIRTSSSLLKNTYSPLSLVASRKVSTLTHLRSN